MQAEPAVWPDGKGESPVILRPEGGVVLRKVFSGMYGRYVLAFSAIVLTLILVMGGFLYRYYFNTIYDDFLTSNGKYLSSVADQHEKGLEMMKNVSVQLGTSNVAVPFQLQENPLKTFPLKNQLHTYKMVSQFYDGLFFMFRGDQYLYNDSTSVQREFFLEKGLLLSGGVSAQLRRLLSDPGKLGVLKEQPVSGFLAPHQRGVLYALPVNPNGKGTMLFLVGSSYYDALLSRPKTELRATYILKDGKIVAGRGDAPFSGQEVERTVSARGEGHFEEESGSGNYLFCVIGGTNGFRYCTVQSLRIFQDKLRGQQWGLLFFLVLLVIPSAAAVAFISRKLEDPVRALRGMFRSDSGGKDWDVIQNGIRELTEVAENSLTIRRSELMRGFLRGAFDSRGALVEAGRKVGLALDRKYFAVALTGNAHPLNEKPLIGELLQLFRPGEAVAGYGFELIDKNQMLFVFFADEPAAIDRFAARLAEEGKRLGDKFVMAMSALHEDCKEISAAYLEANTAFDSRFLKGESDILRFADLASCESVGKFPQAYLESLKNALRLGDEEAVHDGIRRIFRYLRSSRQSLFAFRVVYNEIINVLIRECDPGVVGLRRIYDVFSLSHCLSIQDLDDMLRSVCDTILRSRHHGVEDVHGKMQEAADYMQQHYGDSELNMNALADHLSVSAVTLSIEFKKQMGMNPSDYLTLLRIDRAKELLLTTSLSLREISGAVGYCDVPGFIRRFKRHTAQTPLQFRRSFAGETAAAAGCPPVLRTEKDGEISPGT